MNKPQPSIPAPLPPLGQSLSFRLLPGARVKAALKKLTEVFEPSWGVVGLGAPLLLALGRDIPGSRTFPAFAGPGCSVPSTQEALWIFLRGDERGILFQRRQLLEQILAGNFVLEDGIDTFVFDGGRDLSGYLDGTENPKGKAASRAAFRDDGSSFVVVQRWVHDLKRFRSLSQEGRDAIIGRRHADNEEIADAPASAHVKRSAQESFDPDAFMLRRSMPWATEGKEGLEFICYVENLDRFEQVMRRMCGLEDGVVDALFQFSRPLRGACYWCPPVQEGRLLIG